MATASCANAGADSLNTLMCFPRLKVIKSLFVVVTDGVVGLMSLCQARILGFQPGSLLKVSW